MNRSVTREDVKKLSAMNHYERLGVDKSGDSVAIKRAYRIASMRYVVYRTHMRLRPRCIRLLWTHQLSSLGMGTCKISIVQQYQIKIGISCSLSLSLSVCVCRRYHPDKAREEDRVHATECFQMVNVAHAVLGDPMKRQA